MIIESKPLLVIYKDKDEMILNELKKLVDTKDDNEDGSVVGTEDGTVKIVAWNEKTWLQNKKAGNTGDLADKILFIGDIKGTDKLEPVLNIKFDEHGIRYGIAGNQALLLVDVMKLYDDDSYNAFLEELRNITNLAISKKEKKRKAEKGLLSMVKYVIPYAGPILLTKDAVSNIQDIQLVREQMLFYGITKLYLNDLDSFMKA